MRPQDTSLVQGILLVEIQPNSGVRIDESQPMSAGRNLVFPPDGRLC
jgi:hypothetical protein